jgi:Skp family chaperone for outer membrane proteins
MKVFSAIVAAAFLSVPAFAQTKPAAQPSVARPTPLPATQPPTGPVPDTKIALINSDAFFDEKQGLTKLVNAVKLVQKEFEPTKTQLAQLQQRIDQATKDLSQAISVQDQRVSQQKQTQIDDWKKELQRKQEDAEVAYEKRMQEKLAPINDEITKALDAYAKAHGLTLVLDIAKMGQMILAASETMDITRAFIIEYNSRYPATASVAPPE